MDFSGKVIVITGASQGIGAFLARFFAVRGAHVVLAARTEPALRETASAIEQYDGVCSAHPIDLRDVDSLAAFADALRQAPGHVDILINNAADVTSKPFLETSAEEIAGLVETNIRGPLQLSRLLVPFMENRDGATIVNISSLAGHKANTTQTVYSITKSAVNAMSDALRSELSDKGVHVLNVSLGSVGTESHTGRGQTPVATFAHRLEHAIARREEELFLSPVSRWLMRLYKVFPALARMRD